MDLKYLMSDEKIEKIINETLKGKYKPKISYGSYSCNLTPFGLYLSELYLKSLILYIRSEKATEDSLYDEIYKLSLLPIEMQKMIFSEKKEKDYYIAFEKFLNSSPKGNRQFIADVISDIAYKKVEENIFGDI